MTAQTLDHWLDELNSRGEKPAVVEFQKDQIRQFSYEDLARVANSFAAGLRERGIGAGEKIAFLAASGFRWIAACLGTIKAGAVPVPLDVQFDDEALVHVLKDSEPRLLIAETRQAARLEKLEIDSQFEMVFLDDDESEGQSWNRLMADSSSEFPSPGPDDEAVLFYTSGTTGAPKGVPLTQRNLASQIEVLLDADLVGDEDRVLLPLPLHHVYPFVVGLLTPLARGLPIVLPYSLTGPQMVRALKEGKVTLIIGVPRLYRALADGITQRVESGGRFTGAAFRCALRVSTWLRRGLNVRAGKLLLRPLHREFGPNVRVAACGGSPLDDDLAWTLESLGWQVAVGYGLTETSPLLTLNPPGEAKIGTVGRPVPNVELKIVPMDESEPKQDSNDKTTGEIVVSGPGVFGGYRNLPEKTDEVLTDDGWFHTDDLGFLDDEGYLHISGRKGTMIVTEGGENVEPNRLEKVYAGHPAIREIGVLEEDGKLVGLIVPETHGAGQTNGDGEELEQAVGQAVETQGKELRSYERLSEFQLTRESLPRTRLGKIQRHKLRERYETAATGREQTEAEPISIEEMASEDRAVLDDAAARQVWDLLAERYSDRRLTPDTSLQLDLGVDSLEWMNLSLTIGRRAGVEIEEAAMGRIETVRDLLKESADASAQGGQQDLGDPLEDPEASLKEDQRRYLEPLGPLNAVVSRSLFGVSRCVMRTVYRLDVKGAERLPDGPCVIAPNHLSYLDAPAVAAAIPPKRLRETYWAGWTGSLFTNPVLKWLSRLCRVVPIDPQSGVISSLAFGAAVLDRGHNLVWFPEGERSPDGELKPFRAGIGLLLERYSVPVVPMAIEGTHEALPPGRAVPRLRKVTVTFGDPLDPKSLTQAGEKEPHQQIAKALRDAVAGLKS